MSLMLFTHYLLGYVGSAMCSIGLLLSLCSVYVFTRRQMRGAVSTYLAGLSISDSCLLCLGLLFSINYSIPPEAQSDSYYSSRIHKRVFPYIYALINCFQFTSVWIIIGFAVDRWFAIKWPMLHYTYSSKRASYIVGTIYCLGLIYSLPRFFEYRTDLKRESYDLSSPFENNTMYVEYYLVIHRLGESRIYQYCVHLILYSLFQSILPLLMLSYFNVELIRSIHASSNFLKRCATNYGQKLHMNNETSLRRVRETIVTRSVICLIGLFIICQVPASILNYIYMYYRHDPLLYICYDISNFLILFNSAVNFFIFAFFNRKFRRQLALICFRTRARASGNYPSSNKTSSHTRFPVGNALDNYHLDSQERNEKIRAVDDIRNKSDYQLRCIYQQETCGLPSTTKILETRKQKYKKNSSQNKRTFGHCCNKKNYSSSSTTSSSILYNCRSGHAIHYVIQRREPDEICLPSKTGNVSNWAHVDES